MPPKKKPAKGKDSGKGRGSDSDSDDDKTSHASKRELPTLTGKETYDIWWSKVKTFFYQKGKKWDEMLAQAKKANAEEDDDPDPTDEEYDTKARRNAWGVILNSLSDEEAKKYRGIEEGRVESLIRSIRANHEKISENVQNKLLRQAMALKLHEYADLETYIAEANILFEKMKAQGDKLSDSKKRFYMLEGLPTDYDLAKNALMMPERNDSYKGVCDYLLAWVESRPNCPGYAAAPGEKRKTRSENRVLYANERGAYEKQKAQLCRNFQKSGKCVHGDNCKFRHVKPMNRRERGSGNGAKRACFECGSESHLVADCPKKQRRTSPRLKEKSQKTYTAAQVSKKIKQVRSEYEGGDCESPAKKRKKKSSTSSKKKSAKKNDAWHVAHYCNTSYVNEKVFKAAKAAKKSGGSMRDNTIIDGGSTCSITTDFAYCKNIRPCKEKVTVGGKSGYNMQAAMRVARH